MGIEPLSNIIWEVLYLVDRCNDAWIIDGGLALTEKGVS
jgi:hypothetical protein